MLPILGVPPRFGAEKVVLKFGAEGTVPRFGILTFISSLLGVGAGRLGVAAGSVGFGCRLGAVLVRLLFCMNGLILGSPGEALGVREGLQNHLELEESTVDYLSYFGYLNAFLVVDLAVLVNS